MITFVVNTSEDRLLCDALCVPSHLADDVVSKSNGAIRKFNTFGDAKAFVIQCRKEVLREIQAKLKETRATPSSAFEYKGDKANLIEDLKDDIYDVKESISHTKDWSVEECVSGTWPGPSKILGKSVDLGPEPRIIKEFYASCRNQLH